MTHCEACNAIMGEGVVRCLQCGQFKQGPAVVLSVLIIAWLGFCGYMYYSITSFLGIPFFGF
jgi:hypothetical protein